MVGRPELVGHAAEDGHLLWREELERGEQLEGGRLGRPLRVEDVVDRAGGARVVRRHFRPAGVATDDHVLVDGPQVEFVRERARSVYP